MCSTKALWNNQSSVQNWEAKPSHCITPSTCNPRENRQQTYTALLYPMYIKHCLSHLRSEIANVCAPEEILAFKPPDSALDHQKPTNKGSNTLQLNSTQSKHDAIRLTQRLPPQKKTIYETSQLNSA